MFFGIVNLTQHGRNVGLNGKIIYLNGVNMTLTQLAQDNIKTKMKNEKLSYYQLADKVKIDQGNLYRVLNKNKDIRLTTLEKLIEALKIKPASIFK